MVASLQLGFWARLFAALSLGGSLAAETAIVEARADARLHLEGRTEILLLDFRTASIATWEIRKATLLLHVQEGEPPKMLLISLVPARWTEDAPERAAAGLFRHSGRFQVRVLEQGWIQVELSPSFVAALAREQSFGLAVEQKNFRLHGRKPPQFAFVLLVEGGPQSSGGMSPVRRTDENKTK